MENVKKKREFMNKSTLGKMKRYKYLYILMIPGILWYLLFHILPLYGILVAFEDFKPRLGITGSPWVGLKHFVNLFSSQSFPRILGNTVFISALKLFCGFPMPIILALSVNSIKNKFFKKSVQTLSYLPNFLSWVVVYGISYTLFNDYDSVFRNLLVGFGLNYSDPTANSETFIAFLVLSSIWKGMGMSSIIYLASLAGIDQQLYEAATVDGASKWKQLWKITIPCLMPICAIVLILSVGSLVGGDFEQIFLYQRENPSLSAISDIFETYIFRNGIRAVNFSAPAAVGIFQSIFAASLVLITNKVAKKLGYEGIW